MNADTDPAHPPRRRADRRALAIVLIVHVLLAAALLNWRPWLPALPAAGHGAGRGAGVAFARLSRPAPPPARIANPSASGARLAARPGLGLPAATTGEHQSAPLPNPAAIDAAASKVGAGGTGRAGAGAASTGKPGGSGRLFEDCAAAPERAIVADVYRLSPSAVSVGAMRALKPAQRVCLAQLNVAPRNFHEGFPGMPELVEWFGLDVRFTVKIAEAGTWDLVLLAGDGAILSIDGVDVIDNDGLHEPVPKTARVRLAAGLRRFRVRYFKGPGEAMSLLLGWKKGSERQFDYIPRGLMGRPPGL